MAQAWTLLIYRVPSQPTKLRIQVWRKLQALGALYIQDGVAALPARDDLDENLLYVAQLIEQMEGSALLLKAAPMRPQDSSELTERFRVAANARMESILGRLQAIELPEVADMARLSDCEEAHARERTAYLKARRLSYCGSDLESLVEQKLTELKARIDVLVRGAK